MSNTTIYPVVFTPIDNICLASAPDFPAGTQGANIAEAIEMIRDAIGLMGITLEDMGQPIPTPSNPTDIVPAAGQLVSLVDIDFAAYRRAHEQRTVRRNVSLPSWLNYQTDQAGINVSAVLQTALKKELQLAE